MKYGYAIRVGVIVSSLFSYSAVYESHSLSALAATLSHSNLEGETAPEFELKSLDGHPVKLSDFRGKALVLNFWTTWCAPCKTEMPWFVELNKQYRAQGVEIVGIALDDVGHRKIAKFIKKMNVHYTVLLGNEAVGEAYGGMHALPQTFFIGRDGKIIRDARGIQAKRDLEDGIKQSLGAP